MDSTPPSHRSESRLRIKSSSRLSRIDKEDPHSPYLSQDQTPTSPKRTLSPYLSLRTSNLVPPEELLLSPSPLRKSRTRLVERTEMVEEPIDLLGSRRRCKSRGSPMGLLGCASPRNGRRARRRLEQEIREERELGLGDENGKPRKRKQSSRSRKEKLSLVLSVPSSSLSPSIQNDDQSRLNHIGQLMYDLIMWKDVSKSSLWFGFGSLCFLSSCFARSLRFSVFSAISQLGLLFLAVSFFYNSFSQRNIDNGQLDLKLKENDILRLARVVLPVANLVIAKMRKIFSGEPSMTLKVAPLLLFGAEYGHFITLWRLCVTAGFFISFTIPKLYTCYSVQMNRQVEHLRGWVVEAWGACSHKKIVAASLATVFWNLSSLKTRIFAAFISVAILRYYRQHEEAEVEEREVECEGTLHQQQQALVLLVD
ncbi:Reticulon [Macleaya cordata]|uniref:Reticulon-like protein n=1 Tax=Macleaya cordata TaxID=56857 RepID=A0A200PQ56_MACCD|nr:Reticulon [Macleaya cordata]